MSPEEANQFSTELKADMQEMKEELDDMKKDLKHLNRRQTPDSKIPPELRSQIAQQ
ncbi:hypothetical protein L0F63_007499, partial [Massospora cicadina]